MSRKLHAGEIGAIGAYWFKDRGKDFYDFIVVYNDHTWDGFIIDNWGDLEKNDREKLKIRYITMRAYDPVEVCEYLREVEKKYNMKITAI